MARNTFRSTPRFNTRPTPFEHSYGRPFFVVESVDTASYADDTTPCVCLENIDMIIEKHEVKANEIFQWFNENAMKANTDKCLLLITTNEERNIPIGGEKIQNSKSAKLLGVNMIINCLLLSMYIKSVIRLVKSLTHWLDYLVL